MRTISRIAKAANRYSLWLALRRREELCLEYGNASTMRTSDRRSPHHLNNYLLVGIPEIQLPNVEPFKIDSLSLALTNGPNGYKITLRDIDAYGASNFMISKIK